eukprot:11687-Eustigmatos_ZCMA.PRE.1
MPAGASSCNTLKKLCGNDSCDITIKTIVKTKKRGYVKKDRTCYLEGSVPIGELDEVCMRVYVGIHGLCVCSVLLVDKS